MKIEVSNGEIIDKWTILQIKRTKIKDGPKRINVLVEMEALEESMGEIYSTLESVDVLKVTTLSLLQSQLHGINIELWEVEDGLRELERMEFWNDGDELDDFVGLARNVYFLNDKRADIKKQINELTNSRLVEEKSYEEY